MTVDTPVRHSPLEEWHGTLSALPSGVEVSELPFLTQLTLRVTPDTAAARAVEGYLGYTLPPASRAQLDADVKALWLGPDEWLLLAPPDTGPRLVAELRAVIGEEFASVTDTSAQRTVLALSGSLLPDLLAQGCALDLSPRSAGAGACFTTLLAQAGVTLVVREEGPGRVWLLVRSSFADYLAAWLTDACTEYGGGDG